MSVERPDFLEAYTAVEVQGVMRSMDATDTLVVAVSNTFFTAIRTSLDISPRSLSHLFEIEQKALTPIYPEERSPEHMVRTSDEYIRKFKRRGGQTLASILYTRDDFNYQDVHFAKYPLLPITEEEIRTFQHLELVEDGIE